MTTAVAEKKWLLHAEYCDGPFYMGWWLYSDPVVDGAARYTKTWDGSHWFRGCDWDMPSAAREIVELVESHGAADLPPPRRYGDDFAEAFAKRFPLGIVGYGPRANPSSWDRSEVASERLTEGWPYGQEEGDD